MKIDKTNWIILEELQNNARMPLTELSKKVDMTSPTVAERIQKLENAQIIDGYEARLNMRSLGYLMGVFISIKIRFGQVQAFEEFIPKVPEICECHKLTGHDCMLMKGYVRDPAHLEELNTRLAAYGELTTSLVLKSIVERKVYSELY
ncbi:MAG: Lrp/AsnC family transcriptional regulator [Reichenbachiella sp.]|uniref:Lrp/AsnC family transcriptional regulator n=1 Tax=Reichenbachiella sp. TaxID=2184521 RepID=UPI003267C1CE